MWRLRTWSLSELLSKWYSHNSQRPGSLSFTILHSIYLKQMMGGVKRRKRLELGIHRETVVMADMLKEPMRPVPQRERVRLEELPAQGKKIPFVIPHLCR